MLHNDVCRRRMEEVERQREEWAKAHPGYCRKCEGRGGQLHDRDLCPECLELGKCPWCGEELVDAGSPREAYALCVACGWNEADHEDRGMPPLPECECWM